MRPLALPLYTTSEIDDFRFGPLTRVDRLQHQGKCLLRATLHPQDPLRPLIRKVVDESSDAEAIRLLRKTVMIQGVERRDSHKDVKMSLDCMWHTFRVRLREKFDGGEMQRLEAEGTQFLLQRGYTFVDVPRQNDVVIYGKGDIDVPPAKFNHVGILGEDHLVLSKWGAGNVYEHPVYLVPPQYGDDIVFMRKA